MIQLPEYIDTTDTLLKLMRAIRSGIHMTAADFYRICGIRPQTVRVARYRARKRGLPEPVPLTEGTYNVDLIKAIEWLNKTGRYGAVMLLKAHLDEITMDSISIMRGVRAVHSKQVLPDIITDQS